MIVTKRSGRCPNSMTIKSMVFIVLYII